jgi:hypothetical protein
MSWVGSWVGIVVALVNCLSVDYVFVSRQDVVGAVKRETWQGKASNCEAEKQADVQRDARADCAGRGCIDVFAGARQVLGT